MQSLDVVAEFAYTDNVLKIRISQLQHRRQFQVGC